MEFINNWKEKSENRKQQEAIRMSRDLITLSDFDSSLYIAYQGNPLIKLEDSLNAGDILQKLTEARNNFINGKMHNVC